MDLSSTIAAAGRSLWIAGQLLLFSAALFGLLALLVKGREALDAGRRAAAQVRINLSLYALDALLIAPLVGVLVQGVRGAVSSGHLFVVPPEFWGTLGTPATFVAAVFLGDFGSYWRHRMEHTRWLWPAHAVHHSDDQMTWLTLSRFHPVNRVTTATIDIGFLALLGLPDWALVANELVRHYYGELIHADLPWTYGTFGRLLVSPAMHRWHHARDVTGAGSNFATVFSVFDQAFGTFHVPGPCTVPVGVTDDMIPTTWGQLVYPFRSWADDALGRQEASRIEPATMAPAGSPGAREH